MAKKRVKHARSSGFEKLERKIEKDVKKAEQWVVERRKFFIKLGWLTTLVIALLILSSLLIKIGVGSR